MEKAYDVKALGADLKSKGLIEAEDMAIGVIESLFAWLEESAALSENPYDDFLVVAYPKAKELALAEADKIDGKEG